ncbi:MAG: EI24 domain-containing protein [Bacteroidia bacterium]
MISLKNIIDNFKLSIQAYAEANSIIWQQGFWKFLIYPSIIATLFFISTFSLAMVYLQWLVDWLYHFFPQHSEIKFINFLLKALYYVLSIGIRIIYLLLYLSLFRNMMLIILAPLMAYLAEKTAHHLGYNTGTFRWNIFLKNTWRGIRINTRNLFKELLLTLLLFIISFIPGLGLFTPIILVLVQSYFYGFSMMDYSMELKSFSIKESLNFMRNNKSLAISNGLIFYALFLIPFIGWIFAPVYGTVAATVVTFKKLETESSGQIL